MQSYRCLRRNGSTRELFSGLGDASSHFAVHQQSRSWVGGPRRPGIEGPLLVGRPSIAGETLQLAHGQLEVSWSYWGSGRWRATTEVDSCPDAAVVPYNRWGNAPHLCWPASTAPAAFPHMAGWHHPRRTAGVLAGGLLAPVLRRVRSGVRRLPASSGSSARPASRPAGPLEAGPAFSACLVRLACARASPPVLALERESRVPGGRPCLQCLEFG